MKKERTKKMRVKQFEMNNRTYEVEEHYDGWCHDITIYLYRLPSERKHFWNFKKRTISSFSYFADDTEPFDQAVKKHIEIYWQEEEQSKTTENSIDKFFK